MPQQPRCACTHCLKYFYNDIFPNAFPDRAWGATWGVLKEQGKSDKEIEYILHPEDYEYPIDHMVREGEYWGWNGHSSVRAFCGLGVGGSQYSHWANYLKQYIQAAPPTDGWSVSSRSLADLRRQRKQLGGGW